MKEIAINTIFAIPAIFILLGIEYFRTKRKCEKYFSFDSSVSNISIGIAERLAQFFFAGYFLLVFQFVYKHFALLNIPVNLFSWVSLVLLTDFLYSLLKKRYFKVLYTNTSQNGSVAEW